MSILNEVKEYLDEEPEFTPFDNEIYGCINSTIAFLTSKTSGIKPVFVRDDIMDWNDLGPYDEVTLEQLKEYIKMKCKQKFTPPTQSFILENLKQLIAEAEWYLVTMTDK